jgi:secreted Zn-dependent insulinase-like peptidase
MMQILDKDKNLRLKSQRFWLAISNNNGQFDMQEKLKMTLLQLSKTQLTSYTYNLFKNHSVRLELSTNIHREKTRDKENKKQALTQ